jgi:hypothetical protein
MVTPTPMAITDDQPTTGQIHTWAAAGAAKYTIVSVVPQARYQCDQRDNDDALVPTAPWLCAATCCLVLEHLHPRPVGLDVRLQPSSRVARAVVALRLPLVRREVVHAEVAGDLELRR